MEVDLDQRLYFRKKENNCKTMRFRKRFVGGWLEGERPVLHLESFTTRIVPRCENNQVPCTSKFSGAKLKFHLKITLSHCPLDYHPCIRSQGERQEVQETGPASLLSLNPILCNTVQSIIYINTNILNLMLPKNTATLYLKSNGSIDVRSLKDYRVS
jgi:hypothetical protein